MPATSEKIAYRIDVIAKMAGTTFGFVHEEEAATYAEAYAATLATLRAKGFNIVKARRARP